MKSQLKSNQEISKQKHPETEGGKKKAILMYISNNSGMATLLQQKNCMKTLTNGGGVSNATNSNVSSSGGSGGNGPSAGINANGANTIVTHHHIHNHHLGSIVNATQQTRMLRQNEMVSIPIGSIVSTVGSGNGNSGATQGALLVTGYQTTSHHHNNNNNHSQPLTDLSVFSSSSQHKTNTMFSHNNQQQHYNASASAATTTASGTTTQTRYFSQFSNNHQQHQQQQQQQQHELNSILYPVSTTSSGTNTVNRIVSSNHHSASSPAANSNSNLHSNAYTIVKQELHPPNSNQLPHLQINQPPIKTEPPFEERVNGDKEQQTFLPNGNPSTPKGNATEEVAAPTPAVVEEAEPEPEIDIVINNVVCSFSVRCHLNLREIALQGFNVEFRRENGMVTMKLRRPYTTASIWSSGRITCTGATSEDQAKIAARRYARCLQKLGFRVRFNNFRVVNVLGTCSMPFAIKIVNFSEKFKKEASYEPELHPGVTYKLRFPKATLKIFSTGSITVTAASVANVQAAIEHIFPLVYEFRKKRSPEEMEILRLKQLQHHVELTDVEETVVHSPPSAKRKRRKEDGDGQEEDVDDPTIITEPNATDDIIMVSEFDDPEDLIEGPDDEDDDL